MDDHICPVNMTLQLIGGKYKALILWNLMEGTLRFNELQKKIPHASQKMLTQHLRELETENLISRQVYASVPPKVEYSLTERGMSVKPVLDAMFNWGSSMLEQQGLTANCSMHHPSDHSRKTRT